MKTNRLRDYMMLLSVVLLVLLGAGRAHGQSSWGGTPPKPVDEDGNRILEYEDFENTLGEGLPQGWTQEALRLGTNNFAVHWRTWAGGGRLPKGQNKPASAWQGEKNICYFGMDARAATYLITPPTNLQRSRVKAPTLSFRYVAWPRGGVSVDRMTVFYRFGLLDKEWKKLEVYDEQYIEWTLKSIQLKEVFKDATDEQLSKVQFAFLGESREGFGVSIDELMVVEVEGRPMQLTGQEFRQLQGPVGVGTKLNDVARVQVSLGAGGGEYRIAELGLEYTGTDPKDIDKLYLYHSSGETFIADEGFKVCELKFEDGRVTGLEGGNAELMRLGPGKHNLWVVADVNPNARRKNEISFKLPAGAFVLHFYNNNVYGPDKDLKLPNAEQGNNGNACKIYALLYSDGFEDDTHNAATWEMSEMNGAKVWVIGKPAPDFGSAAGFDYESRPRQAYAGAKVLATGRLEGDMIKGGYPSNARGDDARAVLKAGFEAKHHFDVQLKLRYFLNLAEGDEVRIEARGEGEAWSIVWRCNIFTRTYDWKSLVLDISRYASRREKVYLRFIIESDANKQESGLYIDDIQVLGDYIEYDVGIVEILKPEGLEYSNASKLKVVLKNFGDKDVTADIPVKIRCNGVEKSVKLAGGLAKGATGIVEVDGLPLAPDAEHDSEISVHAEVDFAEDDDKTNNGYSLRFYSYPTFTVDKKHAYPARPEARMQHWYGEPYSKGNKNSWVQVPIAQLTKASAPGSPFDTPPFYSAYVWTTGIDKSFLGEHSTLTGPVFNLVDDGPKELILGYTMLKDVKLGFEYTTDGKNWIALQKATSGVVWDKGWYDGTEWQRTDGMASYEQVKVVLPVTSGKVQLRAVFEGLPANSASSSGGVAINGVEVRNLRPDLHLTDHSPKLNCSESGQAKLKLKVQNKGPVASATFECPVEVRVSEYISATETKFLRSELVTLNLPVLEVNATQEFETTISEAWDYTAWGYHFDVTLRPELSDLRHPDEEPDGNVHSFDMLPMRPPYLPIAELNPVTKELYVKTLTVAEPYELKPIGANGTPPAGRIKWAKFSWEQMPGGANVTPDGTSGNAEASTTGKVKLKYEAQLVADNTQTCPNQELIIDIKTSINELNISQVQFVSQQDNEGSRGCYKKDGEDITLVVTNKGRTACAASMPIVVYCNGVEVKREPTANTIAPDGGTLKMTLSGVRLPKGQSRLLIVAEPNSGNLNFSANSYEKAKLFRWEAPEVVDIYVRERDNPKVLEKLPFRGAVVPNYSSKVLELYVPEQEGVSYRWYRGEIGATGPFDELAAEGNACNLGEVSAAYELELSYAGCTSGRYPIVSVYSDDIEVLGFTGVIGQGGVCRSDDGVRLQLDLLNRSRTTYPAGTKLKFRMEFTGGVQPMEFEVPLQEDMKDMAYSTIDLPVLPDQLQEGVNRVTIEFLSIGGRPDGNQGNNKLTQNVRLKPTPTVRIDGELKKVVRRKFIDADNYEVRPTYSLDCNAYAWARQNDGGAFEQITNSLPNYTIEGIPADTYKVVASNADGCTAAATITFIQTDIAVAGIPYPASACLLEENNDRVDVVLMNSGSKVLKRDTQIKLELSVDGNAIQTKDFKLLNDLQPGGATTYMFTAPGVKEKLKGVTNARISVKATLEEVEDIDASNDEFMVSLVSFGYPELTLQLQDDIGETPESIGTNKYKVRTENVKADIDVRPSGAAIEWRFLDPATALPISLGYGVTMNLPTVESKAKSEDRAGSGNYFVEAKNVYGCATLQDFELLFDVVDLALAEVIKPDDACSFSGNEKLGIQVKNMGTSNIERDTEVNLTITQEISGGAKTTIEKKVKIPMELPREGVALFEVPIDLTGNDGKSFTYTVEAVYTDAMLDAYDAKKDNNRQEGIVVSDLPDMSVKTIKAEDLNLHTDEIDGNKDFTYDEMVGVTHNKVTLSSPEPADKYYWTLGGGVVPVDPDPWDAAASSIGVRGSGEVCMEVTNDKGCSSKVCSSVRMYGVDLVISMVNQPVTKCIGDGHANETVQLVVTNAGATDYTLTLPSESEGFDIEYEIKGPDGFFFKPTQTTKCDLSNTDYFPDKKMVSGKAIVVDMPPIGKKIVKPGKYTITATLSCHDEKGSAANNNKFVYEYEYYDMPSLPDGALGEDNEPFYAPEAVIGVTDQALEGLYVAYKWFDADGTQLQSRPLNGTPSSMLVQKAGTYTLTFEDASGCKGKETKSVRFPAYLELVEQSISGPKSACSFDGKQPVSFKVRNSGQEAYEQPTDGVPFKFKCLSAIGTTIYDGEGMVECAEAIPAGEERELTSDAILNLDELGIYTLQVSIGDGADGSQSVLPEEKRPKRAMLEDAVTHYLSPGKPHLEQQAKDRLKAAGHEGVNLRQIPRDVTFKLNVYDNGDDPLLLERSGFEWIGTDVTEPEIEFNKSGVYQVKITNEYGCATLSDELQLKYIVNYEIEALARGFTSAPCVDYTSPVKDLDVGVTMRVTLADEPLPEGTVLSLAYSVDDGQWVTEESTLSSSLNVGDSIQYYFVARPSVGPGKHVLKVRPSFKDEFDKEFWAEAEKSLAFYVNPHFSFPTTDIVATQPMALVAPEIEPQDEYLYYWNNQPGGKTFDVSENMDVELKVVRKDKGCHATQRVSVRFQKLLTIVQNGEGTVEVFQLNHLGDKVGELKNGDYMDLNRKILVVATPAEGHELSYVYVNEVAQAVNKSGATLGVDVISEIKLEVGFKKVAEKPKPPIVTDVESVLLSDVVCVSPFADALRLLHTEHVAAYEVFNQLGQQVVGRTVCSHLVEVSIPASHLADGVYIVRLTAEDGTVRTLRAVKRK